MSRGKCWTWCLAFSVALVRCADAAGEVTGEGGLGALRFFAQNHGQYRDGVSFVAPGSRTCVEVGRQGWVVSVADAMGNADSYRLWFLDASEDVVVEGVERQAGLAHFFLGNRPERWRRDVPIYAGVRYRGIYSGIDCELRFRAGRLEYDLVVAPEGRLEDVRLAIETRDGKVEWSPVPDGAMVIESESSRLVHHAPEWFDVDSAGARRPRRGRCFVAEQGTLGIAAERLDSAATWVIDPVLEFATYLGGDGIDGADAVSVDAAGFVYVLGAVLNANLPTTPGAFDNTWSGTSSDSFVAKLSPDAKQLVFATYLGGTHMEEDARIVVHETGEVFVAGATRSLDFPTTSGAFDPNGSGLGTWDGHVTKFDSLGSNLVYSTYIGGSASEDGVTGLRVNDDGTVYVSLKNASLDFAATPGAFDTTVDGSDGLVAKLDSAGATLLAATYFGASGTEDTWDLTVDGSGAVHITGTTNAAVATPGAFDTTPGGLLDGYVAKFDATLSQLIYATLFGGFDNDFARAIAVDAAGSAYVTGETLTGGFPSTPGSFQPVPQGFADAFVVKLSASGSSLHYGGFLGGSLPDEARDIGVDVYGNTFVGGSTSSANFPTTMDALSKLKWGNTDGTVTKINGPGSAVAYSTYLGGMALDSVTGVFVDPEGNLFAAGGLSPLAPITPGAFDPFASSPGDPYIAKFRFCDGDVEPYGHGCAGSVGLTPVLTAVGCPTPSATVTVTVDHGKAGAVALMLLGSGQGSAFVTPWCEVQVLPLVPSTLLPLTLSPTGGFALSGLIPAGTPAATFYLQTLIADAAALGGISATNPLSISIGP